MIKLNNDRQEIGKIKELITELFTYVGTHFSNEQKYMKEIEVSRVRKSYITS